MLTKEECRELAAKKLGIDNMNSPNYDKYCIVDQYTTEYEFGWVFCYDSKKYIETKNMQ